MGPYISRGIFFLEGFMDIKNAGVLNANTYDFISICRNVNVNQVRNTWGNKNIKDNVSFNPVGTKFTSTLKGLTDEEKMNEIIRYFLRSNTIYEIIYEVYNAEGYTVIKGLDGRSLRISERHTLSKEILDEIYFKYYLDRGKMVDTSSCDNYIFGSASWSRTEKMVPRDYYFMIPSIMHNKECMDIVFEEDDKKELSDIDKRFFNQVISDLIGEDDCEIFDYYRNFYIINRCDGRKINISIQSDDSHYMENVMEEYIRSIKNRKNEKRLEKKMEGFI